MTMRRHIFVNLGFFAREIFNLVFSPVFIMLTIVGNGFIGLVGTAFFYIETSVNPDMLFIDAIWWSFATATTTGYGDITPVTILGKILGILTMLSGTALFAMYTGLFAEALLNSENFRKKSK